MERVESLINKLAVQLKAGAPAAELLATTTLLHTELSRNVIIGANISPQASVAVWLPAGYTPVKTATTGWPVPTNGNHEPGKENRPMEEPDISVVVEKTVPAPPRPPRVPVPPMVTAIPEPQPINQEEKPRAPAKPLFFELHISDEEPVPVAKIVSPQPAVPAGNSANRPFPQYPDAETLMKNIFPLAPEPAPPAKEVNELVIDPAIPLNQKLQEKKVELRDVLAAGPKITDLRKAISINDKYQMINLLFRSDEDMFERSIRTLNNFGSLPEAHFWMQRELVVKMGWNENDEMVQHFYKLVSRRFA